MEDKKPFRTWLDLSNGATNERTKGRSGIESPNRIFRSKRAMSGDISVTEAYCSYCGHHKAIVRNGAKKCSRCKKDI